MKKRDIERCECVLVVIKTTFGREITGVEQVNRDCPVHGLPEDKWPARHPLRRHVALVDRTTGESVTREEARRRLGATSGESLTHEQWCEHSRRFREERPREVEARLIAEAAAAGKPKRRRARVRR